MKVKELIRLLSDIPLEADIYIDNTAEVFVNPSIEKMEDEGEVIGYLLCEDKEPKQLRLPFEDN